MKNILQEKADKNLHGRLLYSVNFISDNDVADKEILDIGCGYGWCELNLLSRKAKKIMAIELTDKDLETIRQQIIDPKLKVVTASACNLPFVDESIDTLIAWEVIEHIPKNTEDIMFKEAHRVLKPGGRFYLSTPCSSFLTNLLDPAWYFGHRHYSPGRLCNFASNQKFKVIETRVVGAYWTTLSILNLYFSKWMLRRKRIFNDFLNTKEDKEFARQGFANIFIKFQK
ncbi:MAG: class I SAM-dependent methyltransferase [Candidatus Parcubacteria bacterium]|nr:class I SAM-dependent methyltransferase [Candidatus Parcubacteria bacterium]